jgi:two-component system phosphate regulon sensor histidine kinase PhoR
MRRLSRVWKLYIVYTVLLLGALSAGGFLLQSRLDKRLIAQCTENALVLARIVGEVMVCTDIPPGGIDLFCKRLSRAAGMRISILDKAGLLLGDSSAEAVVGDNRNSCPEIVSALSEGSGWAVRPSTTVGIDMCYVAEKIEGTGIIVRVGTPMEDVTKLKNDVTILMALVLYLAPILIVGAVFFVARKLAAVNNR